MLNHSMCIIMMLQYPHLLNGHAPAVKLAALTSSLEHRCNCIIIINSIIIMCRQRHVNKQQVLQRAIQRMRRSELSRCFYLWRDRFGEVDDYARKRRKV